MMKEVRGMYKCRNATCRDDQDGKARRRKARPRAEELFCHVLYWLGWGITKITRFLVNLIHSIHTSPVTEEGGGKCTLS